MKRQDMPVGTTLNWKGPEGGHTRYPAGVVTVVRNEPHRPLKVQYVTPKGGAVDHPFLIFEDEYDRISLVESPPFTVEYTYQVEQTDTITFTEEQQEILRLVKPKFFAYSATVSSSHRRGGMLDVLRILIPIEQFKDNPGKHNEVLRTALAKVEA